MVSLASILLLAVGLAMDATAVAMASGFSAQRVRTRDALLLAFCFGGAQALMPALGWLAGARFEKAIAAWDHWVAFALLAGIGAKMIRDGFKGHDEDAPKGDPFAWKSLMVLAIATSIDALAAGITLPLLDLPLILSVSVIGLVTFGLSFVAVFLGRRFGDRFHGKLDLLGGVILIFIGTKTLVEHLQH